LYVTKLVVVPSIVMVIFFLFISITVVKTPTSKRTNIGAINFFESLMSGSFIFLLMIKHSFQGKHKKMITLFWGFVKLG
jgi:hypothetical protein